MERFQYIPHHFIIQCICYKCLGNWTTEGTGISGPPPSTTTIANTTNPTQPAPFMAGGEDWNVGPSTTTKDWGADDAGGEWGNTDTTVSSQLNVFILQFVFVQVNW